PSLPNVLAGEVTIEVANHGKVLHELILMKTDTAPNALQMEADGGRAEESIPGQNDLGEVEDVGPGTSKSGTFTLAPGRYVLLCNIAGHYKAGMAASFEVK